MMQKTQIVLSEQHRDNGEEKLPPAEPGAGQAGGHLPQAAWVRGRFVWTGADVVASFYLCCISSEFWGCLALAQKH